MSFRKYLLVVAVVVASCGGHTGDKQSGVDSTTVQLSPGDSVLKIDYNEDLNKRSLQEIRLLKSLPYARQGFCFMQADLRGYFSAHLAGYDSLLNLRYGDDNYDSLHPVKLSPQDDAFVKKAEAAEKEKLKSNFVERNGVNLANVQNIVNLFQFRDLGADFSNALARNNFAIVPTDKIQLFHVYEENDYHQVPNFVTTDMYLQLYHMYFNYVLRSLEEHKFIPAITELCEDMYNTSMMVAQSGDIRTRNAASYAATYFAIPYYLLTGKPKTLPEGYKTYFDREMAHIIAEKDEPSEFLETGQAYFGYSLFKPRGHYTRTEALKKYFKAMMWLQTAYLCRDNPKQLERAILMADLLHNGRAGGKSMIRLYNSVFEPIVFLVGEPDNLSVKDITNYFQVNNIGNMSIAMQPSTQNKVLAYLAEISKGRNRIKPKIEVTCSDKINFMPQRYLFDNEILQDLADSIPNSNRAYPRGLDIFAALGNKQAENILINEYKEADNWKQYPTELEKLKKRFSGYTEWNTSVYNNWMNSLNIMLARDASYPTFMQTEAWDKKNLYTALGSWAELKHDAILYGEQPEAAECGGAGPPDPITVGYVEPNVKFWNSMIELISLTKNLLSKNELLTEDIDAKTKQVAEMAQFLLSASEKELRHEKLSDAEYKTIEIIGSSTELLTLSILSPEKNYQDWEHVSGPDKSLAVVADVYTRNVANCNKNGILHEATGNVNEIYVVVEIEGYLYLTKGATFSYYEFVEPLNSRLTDEEWQKRLESKKNVPPIPQWMREIILQSKNGPHVDEKISYSSGC